MSTKRTILIVLLSAGTLFGFASGCASLAHHVHRHHAKHRENLENHVASVCLRTAEQVQKEPARQAQATSPQSAETHRVLEAAERAAAAAERAALAAERISQQPTPTAGASPAPAR